MKLLEETAADKAWRRRGLLLLRRAHPDRLRPGEKGSPYKTVMAPETGGENVPSIVQTNSVAGTGGSLEGMAGDSFAGVVATLLDFPEDAVFRNAIGYLRRSR